MKRFWIIQLTSILAILLIVVGIGVFFGEDITISTFEPENLETTGNL